MFGERIKNVGFRSLSKLDTSKPLDFQLLSMYVADEDMSGNRINVPRNSDYENFLLGNWKTEQNQNFSYSSKCIIFLFGRTADGTGVCVRVSGYKPWAWFETETETDPPWSQSKAASYISKITQDLHISKRSQSGTPPVLFRFENRRRFFGYEHNPKTGDAHLRQHIRISATSLRDLTRMCQRIEHNEHGKKLTPCLSSVKPPFKFNQKWTPSRRRPDIDTPPEFAAMVELGLIPGGWVRIQESMFRLPITYYSHSDFEVECGIGAVKILDEEHAPAVNAPSPMLSFDIETYSSDGFPQAERNPDVIIGIGCVIQWRGDICGTSEAPEHTRTRRIYIANTENGTRCIDRTKLEDPTDEIVEVPNELALLYYYWRLKVADLDADYETGYNINNFDKPYMYKRVSLLTTGSPDFSKLDKSAPWSPIRGGGGFMLRMSKIPSVVTPLVEQTHGFYVTRNPLRGEFDLLQIMRGPAHKFRCYKLDYVGQELIGRGKTEITPNDIQEAWKTADPAKLAAVAHYCIIDCDLVAEIERFDMCTDESRAFARVNRALLPFDVLTSGPVIRTTRALARFGLENNFMLGAYTPFTNQYTYEGGLVIEPTPGLYKTPIMVLDFKSLYPSIIRADGLCASTVIAGGLPAVNAYGLSEDQVHVLEVTPTRKTYFRKNVKGLLPMLVEAFNLARDRTKKLMKGLDPKSLRFKQLNMKQLQEKLAANSAYGVFKQLAIMVAEAITFTGRQMLRITQRLTLELYPAARIVAGDTDSIMVAFNLEWTEENMTDAFKVGDQVASEITKAFQFPKELENEGGYCPYYIDSAKKHYVCKQWLWKGFPEPQSKISAKGMDFVKRDTPAIFRNTDREFFTRLIMNNDEPGAYRVLTELADRIFDPATPISEFDFSTGVKAMSEYKKGGKLPQVVCYNKMEKRQPGSGPRSGDRLQYVIVENENRSQALCDKYEVLEYAMENPDIVKLDRKWYLQRYIDHAKKAFAGLPKTVQVLQTALLRKQGCRTLNDFSGFSNSKSMSTPVPARKRIQMCDIGKRSSVNNVPLKRTSVLPKPPKKQICLRTLPQKMNDGTRKSCGFVMISSNDRK